MRASLERWLLQRWYEGQSPGIGLRAMAGMYRVATSLRGEAVAVRVAAPVIVIGNFTAGGTGKTPLVIALAQFLQQDGWRPGIISRGHGRNGKGAVRVEHATPVTMSGDEPRLMFEQTGLPVWVDSDRVSAASAAIAGGCDLIISDDGLQHRRLARDVEIEVIDGQRGYGNGLLVPAGPLRERPRACDLRVVNGTPSSADLASEGRWPGAWTMHLLSTVACPLQDANGPDALPAESRLLLSFAGAPVHAVAGIGNPSRFFRALEAHGLEVIEHVFPDHHSFTAADFTGLTGSILMTGKDAVKCRGLGLVNAWVVPVSAELPVEFFAAVSRLLPAKPLRADANANRAENNA